MAEPVNLTQAEILARQRMLEEALARQAPDAELFSRMNETRPKEQPAQPDVARGITEAEERGPIFEALSQVAPFERDVIREPQSTFETIQRYNPGGMDGEAFVEEDVRTGYTPGEYGPIRLGTPPIVDAISGGLKFGDRLLFGDDKEQTEARETVRQGIGSLPELPKAIVESVMGGAENVARGNITTRDAEGNITRPGQFAEALTMFPAARLFADVPENSFGIFGGKQGKSGDEAEDIVAMLEESGLDAKEGWERQSGANTYKAYRSSLDGKVRYEIPMQNVSFKGIVREVEDPDVELGKILAGGPEAAEQRLLNMQAMRIRKNETTGKDMLVVPGYMDLDEKVLNQYGFTKSTYLAGTKGMSGEALTLFPAPTLEQVMDFPELFDEYPPLKNIRVTPTSPWQPFVGGSYDPDNKTIALSGQENTSAGRKKMMSILMHEIQHAVQDIEGTYGGANTAMFEPMGFQKDLQKNREAIKEQDKLIEQDLSVIGIDNNGILNKNKFVEFISGAKKTKPMSEALSEADFLKVKNRIKGYVKNRADEERLRAQGKVPEVDQAREKLKKDIVAEQARMRQVNATQKEIWGEQFEKKKIKPTYSDEQIDAIPEKFFSHAYHYKGSDRDLIYLMNDLKKMDVANPEKLTETLSSSFEDRLPALQPLLETKAELDEITSRAYQMYSGNPGEVEARNTQLRFEGIGKKSIIREEGKNRFARRDVPPEQVLKMSPEETQEMVLPSEGLVYSLSEGKKTLTPGERLSMSMDPNDPQMELPGMGDGSGGGRRPPTMDDPAKRLLSKRDGIRGSLDQDTGMKAPTIRRLRKQLGELEREIFTLRKEAGYPTDRDYAKGGMVTDMNRPVISRGLSNLIRNYSQGPLARLNVPRGTVPVQGMFNGGMPFNFDPFASGSELTEQQEEVQAQMAAEALADNAPLPPVPLNQAQQKAYKAGLLQMDDLGYSDAENKEYMYSGDVSASLPSLSSTTTTVPQEQGTSGPADTTPIEDSPASPPIQETLQDAPASDPTVPYTPPVEETTTTTTTQPTTTQPTTTTTQPTTQTTTTQPTTTITQPVSLPYKDPNELAEARAAEAAAAAEAERVRLANLAAQEQLAAEQLAAEEAARVAAEEEQQRLLEAQQAAEAAAQAEEQERIALDQQLAQELAAQEQAQLAAQQNIDSQVSAAEQLAAQQAADRASNEAAIAAEPMPTAVFQAPTPNNIDRSQFGVPPEEGTQAVDPNAPNFLVADMIDSYTSGYAPTLGMDVKETAYPYQGMTEQEMQDQNVYRAEVFQPMPKLSFGTGDAEETEGEQSASSDPEINWDIGSTKPGGPGSGPGRYVELPTGVRIWVPDYGNLSVNTDNAESEAGEYGLTDQQRYQCPGYYTLAFEGGQPYCKKVDKSQWPSGGQQRLRVSKLPSRTAVQVVETNQPGSETQEGYAQGGPVQNFNYGGPAQFQGPFGQALFQRFGQYQQQPQQPQLHHVPLLRQQPQLPNRGLGGGQPMPDMLQAGRNKPSQPGFLGGGDNRFSPMASSADMGLNGRPSVDNTGKFMDNVTGEIVDRRARPTNFVYNRGPESFGQMGPPQQIGQVAEPNTQQLASQLQNVTQQVNQLSSHLGVSGGGQQLMTQGPSQYQPGGLQGGIGGLLQNLRPGLPPPQLRTTGPVRPAMLQFLR